MKSPPLCRIAPRPLWGILLSGSVIHVPQRIDYLFFSCQQKDLLLLARNSPFIVEPLYEVVFTPPGILKSHHFLNGCILCSHCLFIDPLQAACFLHLLTTCILPSRSFFCLFPQTSVSHQPCSFKAAVPVSRGVPSLSLFLIISLPSPVRRP